MANLPLTFLSPIQVSTPHLFKLRPSVLRSPLHGLTMSASPNWAELSRRAQTTLTILSRHPATYAQTLRQHIQTDPENPFLWLAFAKHLAQKQSSAAAVSVLEEAIQRVPFGHRGSLFEALGTLELRRGHVNNAMDIFLRGVVADPYVPLFISLASLQVKHNLAQEARATFREATSLYPHNAALWRSWASAEGKLGDVSAARDMWKTATERDRRNSKAWYNLALAEKRCGAPMADVMDVLRESLTYCPVNPWLRLRLARMEETRGDTLAAIRVLNVVEPRNEEFVLRPLARLEAAHGNLERARSLYRRAADIEAIACFKGNSSEIPTVKALHAWALMEDKAGNVGVARNLLEEAVGITKYDTGIWRALGELETKESNYGRAREAFQTGIAIDPNNARLLLSWGKMEVLADNLQMAESLMQRVSRLGSVKRRSSASKDESNDTIDKHSEFSELLSSPPDEDYQDEGSMDVQHSSRNIALTPHVLAEALRERAMLASRNGLLDDSLMLLLRASQIEPNFPKGWRLLASQEHRLHGVESMRKVYEIAKEKVSIRDKPKLLHWWGQDEKTSGDKDKARSLFRQSTRANPDYMSAWLSWGLMEKGEGNIEEACDIFEEASRRAEVGFLHAPFIFQAWGRVEELDRGRPEFAVNVFQRGINLVTTSGPLWSAWGLLEERRGNIDKARELFENSTKNDPKFGSAWHSWALLESRRCNFERASELYREGHEKDPTDASLLVSWANMEGSELGNRDRGRQLFQKAVTADPYLGMAWHAWGCLEMKTGSIDRARRLFLKAAEVQPNNSSPWHTLGVLEVDYCNNIQGAIENWKKAIEVEPTCPLGYQSWALLEGNKNDNMEEARRLFELGIEKMKRKPNDVALLLQSWAALEEKKGNAEDARRLLRRSLEVDRKRAETWQSLALIEKSRGNREVARQLVKDGVEVVSPSSSSSVLYVIWGNMEAEEGNIEKARQLFAAGVRSNPNKVSTWNAYAAMERKFGSGSRAAEIKLTSDALLMRQGRAIGD